ncbi:MAG: hypothetical protein E5V77_25920, partial [Mesorhizobium sp.]
MLLAAASSDRTSFMLAAPLALLQPSEVASVMQIALEDPHMQPGVDQPVRVMCRFLLLVFGPISHDDRGGGHADSDHPRVVDVRQLLDERRGRIPNC